MYVCMYFFPQVALVPLAFGLSSSSGSEVVDFKEGVFGALFFFALLV